MLKRKDIRIRDPFVLVDEKTKTYYLYGTTALGKGLDAGNSFTVYSSKDLENFSEGVIAFQGDENFWGKYDYWAPEVHFVNGKYVMCASCKADGKCRGTHIFVSDTPTGPFKPLSDKPATPETWECLDGTLWQENGKLYLVFSHEWLQVQDGEIWAVELAADCSDTVGAPKLLFKASDNKYICPFLNDKGQKCYVTDAPFLYEENGKLRMMWSSLSEGNYLILLAEADSLLGEWRHIETPYLDKDGGHAMLFKDLEGKVCITFHQPNVPPKERMEYSVFAEGKNIKIPNGEK